MKCLNSFIKYIILLIFYFAIINTTQSREMKLVFVGDSITEGHDILQKDAYPNLLEMKLKQAGFQVKNHQWWFKWC